MQSSTGKTTVQKKMEKQKHKKKKKTLNTKMERAKE